MIIIDRIEEGIAVCEAGNGRLLVSHCDIPQAGEGDVIVYSFSEGRWLTDPEAAAARREHILSRTRARRRRRDSKEDA